MKLLESLGLKKPPPADPVFRLKKFYDFQSAYWEAEADFSPVGRAVEVLVECPRSGASPRQHAFFRELEARYAEALEAAHHAIVAVPHGESAGREAPGREALVYYSVAFQGWAPAGVEVTPC